MDFKGKLHIVLLSGKAEAGKTTAARAMRDALNARRIPAVIVPYGQYVKDTAKMLFGWDGVKDEAGRQLLQRWGTNTVREIDPSFWCDTVIRLAKILEESSDTAVMIVDDCRFPNEIECWDWAGIKYTTIRIERPGWENALTSEQREHPSETALDDWGSWDFKISTDKKEELEYFARYIVTGECGISELHNFD